MLAARKICGGVWLRKGMSSRGRRVIFWRGASDYIHRLKNFLKGVMGRKFGFG
jgi:hypothetical protein